MKFVSVKTGETGHVVPVWQLSQPRLEMSQTCQAGRTSEVGRQVGLGWSTENCQAAGRPVR